MSDTSIQSSTPVSEHRGYNRGLILGLTMAESMLLLVFCLLLITGAIIVKEKERAQQAEASLENAKAELVKLTEERNNLIKVALNNTKSEDTWRKLVLAQQQMDEITRVKLVPEELTKNAAVIRAAIDQKITPEDIAQIEKLKADSKALSEIDVDPERLKELLAAINLLESILSEETPLEDQIMEMVALAEKGKATEGSKPHEWPPIINLSETKDYYFKSGSAELSPAFRQLLQDKTAHQIIGIAKKYGVDVVEVIGHTDEQRINGVRSNLDTEISSVLNSSKDIAVLKPGDNAGLGLARALAVTQVLSSLPELRGLTILPMSGAQLTLPSDQLTDGKDAGSSEGRRRIEIRVRKRNEIATEPGTTGQPVRLVKPSETD
ncbi:hypothetical protein [Mesorhizobium sp. SP-1A]|uniref:hypothetical protein n=1 Tax=Mesorhizobium sp. SP-1A TaxID=3077840 RepID=UPI0028F701E8|nr:hypothetical protein [Mesorhizobium sp. SP-1A]